MSTQSQVRKRLRREAAATAKPEGASSPSSSAEVDIALPLPPLPEGKGIAEPQRSLLRVSADGTPLVGSSGKSLEVLIDELVREHNEVLDGISTAHLTLGEQVTVSITPRFAGSRPDGRRPNPWR